MNHPPTWLDPCVFFAPALCLAALSSHAALRRRDGTYGMNGDNPLAPCVEGEGQSSETNCGWRAAGCTGAKPPDGEENNVGCLSQWYTNWTFIP